MGYTIWHDGNMDAAIWLVDNSILRIELEAGEDLIIKTIPKNISNINGLRDAINENPEISALLPLLRYDKPDIIVQETESQRCILGIEFMTQTPQSQHTKQRFGRVAAAAMSRVPFAFVLPMRKMKLEKYGTEWRPYRCTPDIFEACLQLSEKFEVDNLVFEWPDDGGGFLRFDREHPTAPRDQDEIELFLEWVSAVVTEDENRIEGIVSVQRDRMRERRTVPALDPQDSEYGTIGGRRETVDIPISGLDAGLVSTSDLLRTSGLTSEAPESFSNRDAALVFSTTGFRDARNPLRTDPYAGMIAMFHLFYCTGPGGQRIRNFCCVLQGVTDQAWRNHIGDLPPHVDSECPFMNAGLDIETILGHIDRCTYARGKRSAMYGTIPDLVLQTAENRISDFRFRG